MVKKEKEFSPPPKGWNLSPSPKGWNIAGANRVLADIGLSPMPEKIENNLVSSRYGATGAAHGFKGAELGRLGGRPKKKVKQDAGTLGSALAQAALSTSARKRQCVKRVRDGSFGSIARLEVCDLAHNLQQPLKEHGFELGDIYTFLSDQTDRAKHKTK